MPPKKNKGQDTPRSFTVEIYGETMWTLNRERTLHYYQRAKLVKEWRDAAEAVAIARKIPKRLAAVEIRFTPHRRSAKGRSADTGGHFPVAKACIDGLVDAGILWEDGPDIVRRLIFEAPVVSGESKVTLEITELEQ
jgi:hypothetical protein